MQKKLIKSSTRGHRNHGWLDTYHSFSFANYNDFNRMNFGVLRVLNDDTVEGGAGFAKHEHKNMEIISIPLEGELRHGDSTGREGVIRAGDVQIMSAGKGIFHEEKNNNSDKPVKFLQIWIFPDTKNVEPRYDQLTLDSSRMEDNLLQIVSPDKNDDTLLIYQDAWLHMGKLSAGHTEKYTLRSEVNGIYLFLIDGRISVAEETLENRDAITLLDLSSFEIEALESSTVLIIEVTMKN